MDQAAAGLTVTVTELARIKGVSQPAISQRLAKFEADGLVTPIREGRSVRVRLAEWDKAANETTDPARLVAAETRATIAAELTAGAGDVDQVAAAELVPPAPPAMMVDTAIPPVAPPTPAAPKASAYTDALTRKAQYDADLREIDIAKAKGELVSVADVQEAMTRCAEAMVREIGQLSAKADDVAAAVAASGAAGARDILRKLERELRDRLASAMTLFGSDDEDQAEAEPEAEAA